MKISIGLIFSFLFLTTAFSQDYNRHHRRGHDGIEHHNYRPHYPYRPRERYICTRVSSTWHQNMGWSPMRLSDNQTLKIRFSTREECSESISKRFRKKICVPSKRRRGKYYLHDLKTNDAVGPQSFGNVSYFNNSSDCYQSLRSSSRKLICMASSRYAGKFYLYSMNKNETVLRDQYFNDIRQCASTIRHRRKDLICAPSGSYPGKFYFHDTNKKDKIGSYFNGQRQCINSMRKIRRGLSCMPSERFPGKFFMYNLRSEKHLSIENLWSSNTIYFNNSSSCHSSLESINRNYVCMPSSRHQGSYYLFDYRNNKPGPKGYFHDLNDCKQALRPHSYYEDRYARDRRVTFTSTASTACQTDQRDTLPMQDENLQNIVSAVKDDNPTQSDVGISPENKRKAKRALSNFLGDKRGEDAIDKILEQADKNNNGSLNYRELKAFLGHIDLGNVFTRGNWADGILDAFGTPAGPNGKKVLTRSAGETMLEYLDLY